MMKQVKILCLLVGVAMATAGLSACNTIEGVVSGVGKDVSAVGNAISGTGNRMQENSNTPGTATAVTPAQ